MAREFFVVWKPGAGLDMLASACATPGSEINQILDAAIEKSGGGD